MNVSFVIAEQPAGLLESMHLWRRPASELIALGQHVKDRIGS